LSCSWSKIKYMQFNQVTILPTYDKRPPLHPVTLTFLSPGLESDFHQFYIKRSIGFVRIAMFLAIFLYMVFGILDYYNLHDSMFDIMVTRVTVSLSILGCLGFTYIKNYAEHLQFLMSSVVILAGLGIIYMIFLSNGIGGHNYYAGLILAVMYAHGLMRLRFLYASITTWFVILAYLYVFMALIETRNEILLNNAFFLIAANIMGMFTSYWIEFYMRNSFWQSKELEQTTTELKSEYLRKSAELDASREIQLDMLPDSSPYHPEYEFAFYMSTASEIGGDYYDYTTDDDHAITLAIGDATGHGSRAGAMVTAIKILFLDHASKLGLIDFLSNVSNSIRRIGFNKLYMSFAIARIHHTRISLAGAGMPAGYLYRNDTGLVDQVELKGFPLGSPADYPYREQHFDLALGDTLMLLTDGLPELFNRDKYMFGYDRTEEIFRNNATLKPQMIIGQFEKKISDWLQGAQQNDDITILILQRKKSSREYNTSDRFGKGSNPSLNTPPG
jgi:hypothetical protein